MPRHGFGPMFLHVRDQRSINTAAGRWPLLESRHRGPDPASPHKPFQNETTAVRHTGTFYIKGKNRYVGTGFELAEVTSFPSNSPRGKGSRTVVQLISERLGLIYFPFRNPPRSFNSLCILVYHQSVVVYHTLRATLIPFF